METFKAVWTRENRRDILFAYLEVIIVRLKETWTWGVGQVCVWVQVWLLFSVWNRIPQESYETYKKLNCLMFI